MPSIAEQVSQKAGTSLEALYGETDWTELDRHELPAETCSRLRKAVQMVKSMSTKMVRNLRTD